MGLLQAEASSVAMKQRQSVLVIEKTARKITLTTNGFDLPKFRWFWIVFNPYPDSL